MVVDEEQKVFYDKALKERVKAPLLRTGESTSTEEIHKAQEEYAAEVAFPAAPSAPAPAPSMGLADGAKSSKNQIEESPKREITMFRSRTIGYTALIVALLSMFVWPGFLGPAAVILGFMAYIGGSRGLGAWSIAIGLLAFATYFFLVPFYS
jgi:hypothetical protein